MNKTNTKFRDFSLRWDNSLEGCRNIIRKDHILTGDQSLCTWMR